MSSVDPIAADPVVSVVIPVYNAEHLIGATLRSLLRQSRSDFEVLLVDDGSTDRTGEILARCVEADSRIRVLAKTNGGIASARNHGVEHARGRYIAFLDQDDFWHADKLAEQCQLLDSHPDIAAAACYSALIDAEGRHLGWRFGGSTHAVGYREMLEWDVVSGGSVALIRRSSLDAAGRFDESLPMRSDWDMWIRLARQFPIGTVPRVLVYYTRGAGVSSNYDRMADAGSRVLERAFADDAALDPKFRQLCRARDRFAIACFCAVDGEFALGRRFLRQSLSLDPRAILTSPRRWIMTNYLLIQKVLPRGLLDFLHRAGSRLLWGIRRGRSFRGDHDQRNRCAGNVASARATT